MPARSWACARPDDLLGLGEPERHEQQSGLVDVAVVAVDDRDLRLVAKAPRQAVGEQRSAGAAAEDHDPVCHRISHPGR